MSGFNAYDDDEDFYDYDKDPFDDDHKDED
jgi:hypothetical protein